MINEVMNVVRTMVQQLVSMPVVVGSMPPEEGYAVGYAGGAPIETFRTLNANYTLPIVFTGKALTSRSWWKRWTEFTWS
ncbi:MAG: hypothetical protein ACLSA6_00280 [Holdemania massiliensis]